MSLSFWNVIRLDMSLLREFHLSVYCPSFNSKNLQGHSFKIAQYFPIKVYLGSVTTSKDAKT